MVAARVRWRAAVPLGWRVWIWCVVMVCVWVYMWVLLCPDVSCRVHKTKIVQTGRERVRMNRIS